MRNADFVAESVYSDFSSHTTTFNKIVDQLSAGAEDVRRSAAFAAGNVAVGNTELFLPTILEIIQTDDKKRYLALQALKEVRIVSFLSSCWQQLTRQLDSQVIIHSSPEALASLSDTLWSPLFQHYPNEEESTRNVAADCLGHLTTSNPSKYLPQLQARLSSESAHERATVIASLRFTFTNDSTSYDELLAPLIVEFFKLMKDSDLVSCHALSLVIRDRLLTWEMARFTGRSSFGTFFTQLCSSQQTSSRSRPPFDPSSRTLRSKCHRSKLGPNCRDGSFQAQG